MKSTFLIIKWELIQQATKCAFLNAICKTVDFDLEFSLKNGALATV